MLKENGNTLLEILLVIAVSSVLIVLAIRYFTVVDFNVRVAQVISKIDILSKASYQWQSAERKPDFNEVNSEVLVLAGLISEEEIKSPWGGTMHVSVGSDNQHVKISIPNINAKACANISNHLSILAYAEIDKQACKSKQQQHSVEYWGEF